MENRLGKVMAQKAVLYIWLTLLPTVAMAADLTITVKEKGSGDPVAEASIILINAGENDLTDIDGNITFSDVALPDTIKILALGYEVLQKELTAKSLTTFYIEPISLEAQTIEVVEDRIIEKTSKITLSAEELKKAPGTGGDPLKVVNSLPGVVLANPGPGGAGFYLRGSGQEENFVWVDRAQLGYLYHFGGIQSTIHPDILQDFNVFLGGFPVEYGDVLGGVLDVKLRSPRRDKLRQKYSVGTFQSSLLLEGPIGGKEGNNGFFLSARRSYIDLILTPETLNDQIADKDKPADQQNKILELPVFTDVQAIWEYSSPYGLMKTQFFYADDTLKAVFNSNKLFDPQSAGEASIQAGYTTANFTWERQWSDSLFSTVPLTYYHNQTKFQFAQDELGNPLFFESENDSLQLQPELRWTLTSKNSVSFGTLFHYGETPINVNLTKQPSEGDIGQLIITGSKLFSLDEIFTSTGVAPYAKYRHNWSDKLNTTLGLRYYHVEVSGGVQFDSLMPRASLEYEFMPNTWYLLNWGQYSQLPRGSEFAPEVGNPGLQVTKAEHRVMGIKHKPAPAWTIQLEAFDKPMTDLVIYKGDAIDAPNNYSNEGTGYARGLDLIIKRDIQNRRNGWLSFSYLDTKRTGDNGLVRKFSGEQPYTLTAVWSQGLTGSWKKWDMGFRFQYHTGLPYDPVVDTQLVNGLTVPIYGEKNADRLPDFYQLDLRLDRYTLHNTWKFNFYIDLQNVLNIQNVTGYDYGDNFENVNNPQAEYGLTLFPSFGVEAEF